MAGMVLTLSCNSCQPNKKVAVQKAIPDVRPSLMPIARMLSEAQWRSVLSAGTPLMPTAAIG